MTLEWGHTNVTCKMHMQKWFQNKEVTYQCGGVCGDFHLNIYKQFFFVFCHHVWFTVLSFTNFFLHILHNIFQTIFPSLTNCIYKNLFCSPRLFRSLHQPMILNMQRSIFLSLSWGTGTSWKHSRSDTLTFLLLNVFLLPPLFIMTSTWRRRSNWILSCSLNV